MKATRTMAKAGKRVLKKDVEKLLHIVRGLRGGTQEDFWQAAVQAAEIQERLDRTSPRDTTKTIGKMAAPGRVRLDTYLAGVVQKLRGTPPRRPNPFRLAVAGRDQRRMPPPIALEELSGHSLEDILQRSRLITAGWHGEKPKRGRIVTFDGLEEGLLQQLAKKQRDRRDLFGRRTG